MVGKLIYLAHTRPDIAFSLGVVSQFMHSPYQEHYDAIMRILHYLKGCPEKGLFFLQEGEQECENLYECIFGR